MDKETMTHYGWILIVAMILAVIISFATPFGDIIGKSAVKLVKGQTAELGAVYDEQGQNGIKDYMDTVFNSSTVCDPGMYDAEDPTIMVKGWDDLVKEGYVTVNGDILSRGPNANGLNGNLVLPPDIKYYSTGTFDNTNIKSVTVHPDSTAYNIQTFKNCKNLKTFIGNENMTTVSVWTFQNCTELTTVYLGEKVNYISGNSFAGCTKLEVIHYNNTKEKAQAAIKNHGELGPNIKKIICTDGELII